MPRTWSNVKYTETRSAAQRAKVKPRSLTLFLLLIAFCVVLFGGITAYSVDVAFRHPITEIPNLANPPKDN